MKWTIKDYFLAFAILESIHSALVPNAYAFGTLIVWLLSWFALEFFHAKSQEVLFRARIERLEHELSETREIQRQMGLAQGLRNPRLGVMDEYKPIEEGYTGLKRG